MQRRIVQYCFFLFGLFDLAAFIVSLAQSPTTVGNFFSYFTNLSTMLAIFVCLAIGCGFHKSRLVQKLQGPATLYMLITGIVYWTVLSNYQPTLAGKTWFDIAKHGIMPIAVFLGWIILPVRNLKFATLFGWLVFPLLFVVYTLIRGPIVGWYPYPFLNPTLPGGYERVVFYTAGILVGAIGISFVLYLLAKRQRA